MRELVRTNDVVLVSAIGALLDSANIHHLVLDQNMSIIEGSLGVMWYPNRYWSIAGPAWILVLILYVFSSAFFFNMMVTKPLSSVSYLRDKHSVEEEAELDSFKLSDDAYAVPQLTDINISDVNKVLFQ